MIFQKYIYNRLKIPQKAERYRPRGSAKETSFEMQFEYLHYTTPRKSMSERKREKLLNKIRRLANWLDNAIPNSPIPLGIDSLLSFIPFVGGFVGSLFTLYQVYLSTLFGIPLWLLLRMLINLVVDLAIGSIPVIGGFADMFYKANLWNYEALVDYLEYERIQEATTTAASTSAASSSASTESKPYYRRSIGEKTWFQLAGDLRHFSMSALAHLPSSSQEIKSKIK